MRKVLPRELACVLDDGVPAVCVAGGEFEQTAAAATDDQWRGLDVERSQRRVVEADLRVGDGLPAPQGWQDLEQPGEYFDAFFPWRECLGECLEVVRGEVVGADSKPDLEAAVTGCLCDGELSGEQDRVAQADIDHVHADRSSFRSERDRGQQ